MSFLQIFNKISKIVLCVGVVDAWKLAHATKIQTQKAQTLAETKNLRQAVLTAQKALTAWSKQPGFWERLLRSYILGDTLKKIHQDLQKWQAQITQADKLLTGAKALLQQDNNNPLETKILLDALDLCNRAGKILQDEQISQTISKCQTELKQRLYFRKLVEEADIQAQKRFFQGAINIYNQADQLYPTLSVKQSIAACEAQVKQEKIYYTAFTKASVASNEGRLRSAIALLEAALKQFPRQDGIELLEKLQHTVKGKEKYRLGLQAEKAGNFSEAITLYKSAAVLLPNSTDCKIRLGIVAIKTEEWSTAISQLKDIATEQGNYLRGFAYAKQGQLQAAHREWQNLHTNKVVRQKENLKIISQRQKLLALKNIEQYIADDNLEQAQTLSGEYLQKFGSDSLVEANLTEHILLRLKAKVWQNNDWRTLADTTIKLWISSPDIINLHNWLIATYYRVFSDASTAVIDDLIIAFATAIANLNQDVTLRDIPWLENQKVDLELVSLELQRRLEETIDKFQANQLDQYLSFRDKYRLEKVALRLMGNPAKMGMKIKELYITPGCYNRFFNQWQNLLVTDIHSSERILQTLYTPWGLSVAACLESDVARAIQIKPSNQSTNNSIELFALAFVAYHEGCYYLQQQQWQKAATHLNQAKSEIKTFPDWLHEIDRLCSLQRQAISEFQENLKFAQFWYDLIGSQLAKSYLAEYKAEELREKLVNKQISPEQALKEIQKITIIDDKNPIVLDLTERLEFAQQFEEFNNLMNKGLYEQAVEKAKKSRHEPVRFAVAEIFIQIIINAAERGDTSDYEMVQQLGRWAYEICPDAPEFQDIYRSLRLRY